MYPDKWGKIITRLAWEKSQKAIKKNTEIFGPNFTVDIRYTWTYWQMYINP